MSNLETCLTSLEIQVLIKSIELDLKAGQDFIDKQKSAYETFFKRHPEYSDRKSLTNKGLREEWEEGFSNWESVKKALKEIKNKLETHLKGFQINAA